MMSSQTKESDMIMVLKECCVFSAQPTLLIMVTFLFSCRMLPKTSQGNEGTLVLSDAPVLAQYSFTGLGTVVSDGLRRVIAEERGARAFARWFRTETRKKLLLDCIDRQKEILNQGNTLTLFMKKGRKCDGGRYFDYLEGPPCVVFTGSRYVNFDVVIDGEIVKLSFIYSHTKPQDFVTTNEISREEDIGSNRFDRFYFSISHTLKWSDGSVLLCWDEVYSASVKDLKVIPEDEWLAPEGPVGAKL